MTKRTAAWLIGAVVLAVVLGLVFIGPDRPAAFRGGVCPDLPPTEPCWTAAP